MDLYSKAKSLNVELNQLLGAYDLLNFLYVHKFLYRPMKKPYIIESWDFIKTIFADEIVEPVNEQITQSKLYG